MDLVESPAIRLTNPAAEFIDNRLDAEFHPSLSNPNVQYDPATNDYRPRNAIAQDKIYHDALRGRDAFLSTIQAYQDEDRQLSRIDLGLPLKSEWDAVLKTVMNAQHDAEINAVKGISGAVRNLTRTLGSAGPAFLAWLQFLPDDAYGCVICGGFRTIIDAAVRHKELCQEVFDALAEIPETIRVADFFLHEYGSEGLELSHRVAKLYIVITETLHGILRFYQERASGRHMRVARNALKALAKGPTYGLRMKADIKNIKNSALSVKEEAVLCHHRRLGKIENVQDHHTLQVARVQETSTQGLNITQKVYADLQDRWRESEDRWRAAEANNSALLSEIMDLKHAITPKPIRKHGPSLKKVLQLMDTNSSTSSQDLEEVLWEAQRFPASLRTQASHFMSSPKLQEWITSPFSRPLLAQGTAGDVKISALSFVASLLIQTTQASRDVFSLYFYCGLQTGTYDDLSADATRLVRQLIAQLLQIEQHDFDLEFIDRRLMQTLETSELEALCYLFEGLIQQLSPSTMLYLVIDGITFYETKDRVQGTCYAISRMLGIIETANFVFKLLVTSPGASAEVRREFNDADIYWLPDVDPDDNEEFNYDVGAFRDEAQRQVRTSQMGLMRTNSEYAEAY